MFVQKQNTEKPHMELVEDQINKLVFGGNEIISKYAVAVLFDSIVNIPQKEIINKILMKYINNLFVEKEPNNEQEITKK
jgi:hypothetical protein